MTHVFVQVLGSADSINVCNSIQTIRNVKISVLNRKFSIFVQYELQYYANDNNVFLNNLTEIRVITAPIAVNTNILGKISINGKSLQKIS